MIETSRDARGEARRRRTKLLHRLCLISEKGTENICRISFIVEGENMVCWVK